MPAKAALLLGQALLLFTFRATAIHFAAVEIILEKKSTAWALSGAGFDRCLTTRDRAFEDGFAGMTPVLSLERLAAFWTSFIGHDSLHVSTVVGEGSID